MIESIPEKEKERDKNMRVLFIRVFITFVFGLVMLLWPRMGLNFLSVLIGFFLLIHGLSALILSLLNKTQWETSTRVLIQRIVQSLLGLVFILRPHWIVNLGINFLFVSAGLLIMGISLIHVINDKSAKKRDSLGQIILFAMGFIMIFAPFFTAGLFIRLLGLMVILFSLGDIMMLLRLRKKPMSQP